jgi:hypothetical protein
MKNSVRKPNDEDIQVTEDVASKYDVGENVEIESGLQAKTDEDAEEKLLIEIEKQYQKQSFIIPSCAQWFDF